MMHLAASFNVDCINSDRSAMTPIHRPFHCAASALMSVQYFCDCRTHHSLILCSCRIQQLSDSGAIQLRWHHRIVMSPFQCCMDAQ